MEEPQPSPDLTKLKFPTGEPPPKREPRPFYDPVAVEQHFAPLLAMLPKPTPDERWARKVGEKFVWKSLSIDR